MKPMTIVFVLLLVLLQYRLWVGNGSLTEVNQLKQQIAQIEFENNQLLERNQSLA
ncbi:MAG: septum formation initiator family protein, partial [Gammaproteobacteria bacterium]